MACLARCDVADIATEVLRASRVGQQITLISRRYPSLTSHNAYQITQAIRDLRVFKGERVVGRKIGFTNKNIWKEYAVNHPNWSYMYNTTVQNLPVADNKKTPSFAMSLDKLLEPRIEPEIVFRISKPPNAAMTDPELLTCINGVAHGFEIVHSVFPGWKFTGADTTAACALHGRLLLGPWHEVQFDTADHGLYETWRTDLGELETELYQGDQVVDTGKGVNVLGSPLNALRHLLELLEKDEWNKSLEAGEIVTTGTLTRAWPIQKGESWWTELRGLSGVGGIGARFE